MRNPLVLSLLSLVSVLGLVRLSAAWAEEPTPRSEPTDEAVPAEATVEVKVLDPNAVETPLVPKLQKPQTVRAVNTKKLFLAAEERSAIEALIWGHVEHVNTRDLDAYMADFRKGTEVELSYAKRVVEEFAPMLEILEFDISAFNASTATVIVVQRANLTDSGQPRVDVVELTYRVRKIDPGWKIDSTARKPLLAADFAESTALVKP